MTNFLDSLNDELSAKQADVDRLTEQIQKLQEEKDRAAAIASCLTELILFYSGEGGVATLLPVGEAQEPIVEEVQEELSQETIESSHPPRRCFNAPYIKFLKPEFHKLPLREGALQILRQHPDEVLELNAIARRLAKDNLKKESFIKFKNSLSNVLGNATLAKLCYRVDKGVYTLKQENFK